MLIRLSIICLWLLAGAAQAAESEHLQMRASYRGLFSAGAQMSIADIDLVTRRPGDTPGYLETRMDVSSEAYGHVEAFYPIRYRFRSWYRDDHSTGLAFEYYEKNNNQRAKHRLIYLDDPEQDFSAHDLAREGELDLPRLLAGDYPVVDGTQARFDRLGLLQRVRETDLNPGDTFALPVTNGRRMLEYRVKVEARESLEVAGRRWAALKLRFDGLKADARDNPEHAHRPVFIWLSDDERHLPLKAVSRHALGRFTVELQAIVDPDRAARLVSLDEAPQRDLPVSVPDSVR